MPTAITDGVDGFVGHDVDRLVHVMYVLLDDADLAHRIGAAGRATARERFSLQRFVHDQEIVLDRVAARTPP